MQTHADDWVKVSARMPRRLLDGLSRLHRDKKLSAVLRELIEREVSRDKVMKVHMRLYGRFKPEHFDESLL